MVNGGTTLIGRYSLTIHRSPIHQLTILRSSDMRILITADLHYRPSQREAYMAFADWVQAQQPDCFIIAGDVGHPVRLFRRALQLFAGLDCPKLLLAGNHDLYRGEHDSRTLWEQALPQAARDEGFVWLEDEVVVLALHDVEKSDFSKEIGLLANSTKKS
ncbi:MAG: metallophosphoesterase, partial [Anaerolineae bacterium]